MFEKLPTLQADPILGLVAQCRADTNPNKIDLGVGVFKDQNGLTPVLKAVKEAEIRYLQEENSKAYLPAGGTERFISLVNELLFGQNHPVIKDNRVATIQATGGCGALRVAAQVIQRANPNSKIWVSDPSWPNHVPLLGSSGLEFRQYPYYDASKSEVDFDAMMAALEDASTGDFVLIHGSCHNPTGADLSQQQWQIVTEFVQNRGLIPFIDMAYLGFGESIDADAFGLRYMAENLPELVLANSFSKNFGLYRERTGTVSIVVKDPAQVSLVTNQLLNVAREIYSMPPAHGAALVETVLADPILKDLWIEELAQMRGRIIEMRHALVDGIQKAGCDANFDFIKKQNGMFSFLGVNENQVEELKTAYSIYMTKSSRISIAGINNNNLPYLCESIAKVLAK